MRVSLVCVCLALSVAILGCGGRGADARTPVTGKVTLDGKPLAGAVVSFLPDGNTQGHGGAGHTDAEGAYKVEGLRGGSGIPAGEYKVAISRLLTPAGTPPPAGSIPIDSGARETLPPHYSDPDRTKLKATVPSAAAELPFDLRSK